MDQATELRTLVRQAAAYAGAPRPRARTRKIVVFGGKGGVGATTIAVNLSAALAQHGERCLLVDAAGGDVALQLRLEPRHTLADVLNGHRMVEEIVVSGPAKLQILPGSREPKTTEHAWNRLLKQLPLLTNGPETIIIDAGNQPDGLARQLWQAADRVLLVTTTDTTAVMNAYASIKLLNDTARAASIALIINRSPSAAAAEEAQQRLAHACRRFLGLPLRNVGAVPDDNQISPCAARGEAFVLAAPACAASLALRQAARAMTNQTVERRPLAVA